MNIFLPLTELEVADNWSISVSVVRIPSTSLPSDSALLISSTVPSSALLSVSLHRGNSSSLSLERSLFSEISGGGIVQVLSAIRARGFFLEA